AGTRDPGAPVSFIPLPPPAGSVGHLAKLRASCATDPSVAPVEIMFTVDVQMNAIRVVPSYVTGSSSTFLGLFLRPTPGIPVQIGCVGEPLPVHFNVTLED